ncbi:CoA transferase subunit A [Desulfitobacterium chlororespirans]|uniref:Acetate CoA/acetoacetate CoA-transferase alpha subunit n=1 Tax=Desulfitobacterium chlororespirans DSM 11544 TaxID=1121395 RepID=A0A1M7SY98_9FIRM|nr:3-oxoacid CoA-transferase subunit A [Desulfitobacterium chlororespirans]SHN63386.1 acetate CoA/acetoacetate CoA-transferase alpha subunit [Desulfitobacterium chlororespirans DSM 11544]
MKVNKVKTAAEAIREIRDNCSIMIGGFMGCGSPKGLVEEVVKSGAQNLLVISNDTDFEGVGVGKLVASGQIKKLIASHIGTNPQTGRKMTAGELEVELNPQGTLAERIRAGGAGLGGVLTPTGLGTVIEQGKPKVSVEDKTYLLETPLKADVALIKAYKGDTWGNLIFRGSARNFNPVMATAADYVIAEVEECVEAGAIHPEEVMLPGIFIDAVVVQGGAEE